MSWASTHIERLARGETVSFRPRGNSMSPRVRSGQLVTVMPIGYGAIHCGDIVLCTVEGRQFLHLVTATDDERVQISNNHGHVNGWTPRAKIHGRLVGLAE